MRKLTWIILLFLATAASFAQVAPRPNPPRLYNNLSKNFPNFLSSSEADQLERKLEDFSNATSNQLCVVITDDNGYEPADYATRILNEWGIGQKGSDNGIVVLLQLHPTKGGRDYITVGYGLEGAIPDLAIKRIEEENLQPYLKSGQNFDALDKTTDKLMQLAKGEIDVKQYVNAHRGRRGHTSPGGVIAIIVIVIIFIILRNLFGGGGGTTYSGRGRSYWGGFGGFGGFGGGGFGGGSGGGFGGFGGGRSGGGGAGGSW